MRSTRVVIPIVVLLIAAVLNLPVAWLCAWASKPYLTTMHSHPAWTTTRVVEHDGWTLYTQARTGIVRAMADRPYTDCAATTVPPHTFPRWCSIHQLPAIQRPSGSVEGVHEMLSDWAYGWPCVAMWHVFAGHNKLWPESDSAYLGRMHFPLNIVWRGFLANTILYALAIWGLLAALRMMRTLLRVRAGLCPRCAYPAGPGPVCSECGNRLPARLCHGAG